ncbi:hypothetical protein CTAYLR_001595 [Chrysophaeum taylorii]|uniref:Uncharacterized protein n=1 Tax=Chrysophaeum taylorii TaxID=2483200 RepID=A0AAD7UE60_9STRA|nr:hypothetical protein CTAYLR_001595 [Chrysophaeum taylorii]
MRWLVLVTAGTALLRLTPTMRFGKRDVRIRSRVNKLVDKATSAESLSAPAVNLTKRRMRERLVFKLRKRAYGLGVDLDFDEKPVVKEEVKEEIPKTDEIPKAADVVATREYVRSAMRGSDKPYHAGLIIAAVAATHDDVDRALLRRLAVSMAKKANLEDQQKSGARRRRRQQQRTRSEPQPEEAAPVGAQPEPVESLVPVEPPETTTTPEPVVAEAGEFVELSVARAIKAELQAAMRAKKDKVAVAALRSIKQALGAAAREAGVETLEDPEAMAVISALARESAGEEEVAVMKRWLAKEPEPVPEPDDDDDKEDQQPEEEDDDDAEEVKPTISEEVNSGMKAAMKAKDKAAVTTLRLIKSGLASAAKDAGVEALEDADAVKVLRKLAKMREESIEMYEKAGEAGVERLDAEKAELAVIERWLPALADEATIRAWVQAILDQTDGAPNKGKVMGALMKEHGEDLDGKVAQKIVAEMITTT